MRTFHRHADQPRVYPREDAPINTAAYHKVDECETSVEKTFASPTYTLDLARIIARPIQTPHYGLYHITNSGACAWY